MFMSKLELGAEQSCIYERPLRILQHGRLTTSMAPPPVHLFKGGKGDSEIPLEGGPLHWASTIKSHFC
ncbi:hypothetical protein GQ55_1G302400 [Panicum hallii var. hallii]|uniref:Uncharacterized protein n=1 Tax=Panicum hallii var. hallii TaxID=1504633 RepID=A0A2T7F930_9POAL|nr:hypothetical protein GQ55_1G302400 [Panicum hallii var. hallii]